MKNVTVIGAGTMGNGIAHVFCQYGYHVNLVDVQAASLERAIQTISRNMDRQVTKGSLTAEAREAALSRLVTTTDLAAGVSQAELVVEAATENVELKLAIFRQLDEHAPAACILASNTSSISLTRIAAVTGRP
ncbi:MAG: 3-hydroxyacyl-CoA dehydrogenase family protein, partial [Bacteroidota bacterium]